MTSSNDYGCFDSGGHIAGSLAVITDAAHILVDLMSFLINIFSLWLSSKPPSKRLTYGWHRAGTKCYGLRECKIEKLFEPLEILGAFFSMIIIWVVTGVLTYLAILKLLHPHYEIEATVMLITSGCAVIANIIFAAKPHSLSYSYWKMMVTPSSTGTPKELSYNVVKERILATDKVESIHSLHIWSLTMNQPVLSAHIVTG
ncbi:hypothetical protein JD844_015771 [Phrynosoma platyrhinos]|uniref:Zinc transporter 8 n=1 Tax=Phrynosoma platyrhinos TaxID=52577 RepID=A0ABQ7SJH2_PHRPL|nr:hypothetical protein JD844_015771 [Phrynosoma platyrhinos]